MMEVLKSAFVCVALLALAPAGVCAGTDGPSRPFFARLVLQGVTFQVESPNEGSINAVTVQAQTPQRTLGPIKVEADGTITNVEIADLNGDGYPEIYVYVTSAGSGSYGSLIAYASNRNRSLSEIHLPSLEDDREASKGYMGHDKFAVGEATLIRRFPVYRKGDTNAKPTGGTRQLQYKLVAGEAGWVLRKDRSIDF